jgi:hypothetical protein
MLLARAMAIGCLTVLKWLFLGLALLLVAATIAQWWRADELAQPVTTSIAAGVSVLAALACAGGARLFLRR